MFVLLEMQADQINTSQVLISMHVRKQMKTDNMM